MRPVPAAARRRPLTRHGVAVVATGLVGVVLLAGCGRDAGPGSGAPSSPSGDPGRTSRATQLLDRFAAVQKGGDPLALAIPPGEMVSQDGTWEDAVGDNDKRASLSGHLVAIAPLPTSSDKGVVVDGTGRRVPTSLVSATDTLAEMTRVRTDCNGCTDLGVTSARLTTMQVSTSSGTATVPAWRFALKGTAVGLLRVALPDSALVEPPEETSPQPGDGPRVDSWSPGPDVRTIRLHFVGAPDATGPCGADYRAEQWSSGTAVVVTVVHVPRTPPPTDVACPAIGALRTVDVALDDPVASRTVLDLAGGAIVPRTRGQVDGIPVR
ncbi:hypothetical protein [Pedococcus soli]